MELDTRGVTAVLDPWQRKVLKARGNILVRSGRQVGKSYIIALKAAIYALENPNKFILIISKTEKQGFWIFAKTLYFLNLLDPKSICKGPKKPTKHIVNIKNGTSVNCYAAGETGFGLMGPTVNLFIADEAAFINDMVFRFLNPTMAVAKAEQWLLSSPFLAEGYFYECEIHDKRFTVFKDISSEDCPRKDQAFLDSQKAILTEAEYAQLYLGQYRTEFQRVYSQELIEKICISKRRLEIRANRKYGYGCDVARFDRDEFTHQIVDFTDKKHIEHVESIITLNVSIPDSSRKIIELDSFYHGFKAIQVDSGGMGITVCDLLREYTKTKHKVVEINNASRPYNVDEKRKKILKEDLYLNLKRLMERGEITLLDDQAVKDSLACIQAEHNKDTGRLSITGHYAHVVEGLIRAVDCVREAPLGIWARNWLR